MIQDFFGILCKHLKQNAYDYVSSIFGIGSI
jgi:hypothetical protein